MVRVLLPWRLPLLVLGFISLAFGIVGGLARLTPLPVSILVFALHGPLMVSAFFGTVISLERAVALERRWTYAAPLGAGLGGVLLLAGLPREGFVVMALAASVYFAANFVVVRRQLSLASGAQLAGAAAWLAGNLAVLGGLPAVPWWIAFFALTVGGERLELSRGLKRGPWVRTAFLVLAAAVFAGPFEPRLLGIALLLLALWLFAFDQARFSVREPKLPRYMAVCLLAGYFWLALGGALMMLTLAYDAALHAIFVGFVFSVVFGHAPLVLPAVLRVRFPYHGVLYLPLVLLHASLAVRVLVSRELGGWGNAAAIVLFILTAAILVLSARNRGQSPTSDASP